MKRSALFASLIIASTAAGAIEVYKCPDPNGRLVLQQTPCEGGQVIVVNVPPPASGPVGLRDSEVATLNYFTSRRVAAEQAAIRESHRQQAISVEADKARAAHEQAAATNNVADAITNRRWGW